MNNKTHAMHEGNSKFTDLATRTENGKYYSVQPLRAIVSLFSESVQLVL
jgi:hypothetical protein